MNATYGADADVDPAWDLGHALRIVRPVEGSSTNSGRVPVTENVAPAERSDSPEFFKGLLGTMTSVIGKRSANALFLFAAYEEGRRLADKHRMAGLAAVFRQTDPLFEQTTRVEVDTAERVVLEVSRSWLTTAGLDALLTGFVEGVVSTVKGRRFKARLAVLGNGDDTVARFELAPRTEDA